MTFLLDNWKIVLIAALMASTALFFNLWRGEVKDYAKFQAETEALGKAAHDYAIRTNARNVKVTQEIKDAIPKQIAAARSNAVRNYLARLPVDAGSGAVSGPTNGAKGIDAAGKESVATCSTGFIQDSAEDAAMIGAWQDWARGIGFPVK